MFFHEPVSKEDVPTYYEHIQHPMDFATMEKKIEKNSYPTLADFKVLHPLFCGHSDIFVLRSCCGCDCDCDCCVVVVVVVVVVVIQRDAYLIVENCKYFNPDDTIYYKEVRLSCIVLASSSAW